MKASPGSRHLPAIQKRAQTVFWAVFMMLTIQVAAQNVPPSGCPPDPPVNCCSPLTTSSSQTWARDSQVRST